MYVRIGEPGRSGDAGVATVVRGPEPGPGSA